MQEQELKTKYIEILCILEQSYKVFVKIYLFVIVCDFYINQVKKNKSFVKFTKISQLQLVKFDMLFKKLYYKSSE